MGRTDSTEGRNRAASTRASARVVALTNESAWLGDVEAFLREAAPLRIVRSTDRIDLIDRCIRRHARVLILDVGAAGEGVVQLIHILREIQKPCAILLLLDEADLPLCTQVLPLGHVTYCIKPIAAREASRLVGAMLGLSLPNCDAQR